MDKTTDQTEVENGAGLKQRLAARLGLSDKLLVLTILFVMIAEVLIYVPSIANYRLNWLRDKLSDAYTAALVLEATPDVPDHLTRQVLDSIGARAVAMKMGQQRRLLMAGDMPPTVDHDIDLREVSWHRAIMHAFAVLLSNDNEVIRVLGNAPRGGEFVEIIMDEKPLRAAMLQFSSNILLLSLIISAITAALVYLSLHYLFVRPLHRITANMTAFRDRAGKSRARHRRLRPAGRDRHRRARARRHAARAQRAAAAEDPARGARPRGVEDQPRPAQPALVGAIVLRPAARARRTSRCSASRRS